MIRVCWRWRCKGDALVSARTSPRWGTTPFLRRRCRCLGLGRAFAHKEGGAVATDVPHQFIPQVFLDQRLMDAFGQVPCRKFIECARKGHFGRQFPAPQKSTDAPQHTVDRQPFNQSRRGRQPQRGLGEKSIRHLLTTPARAAGAPHHARKTP